MSQILCQSETAKFISVKMFPETLPESCLGGPGLERQMRSLRSLWDRNPGYQMGGIPDALWSLASSLHLHRVFLTFSLFLWLCFTHPSLTESSLRAGTISVSCLHSPRGTAEGFSFLRSSLEMFVE